MAPKEAREEKAKDKTKEKAKEKGREAKSRRSASAADRFLHVLLGAAVAVAALLIALVHTVKLVRRRARARGVAEEEAPSWVVSERAILLTLCAAVGLVLGASALLSIGKRLAAQWSARREAAAARAAAAERERERAAQRDTEKVVRSGRREDFLERDAASRRRQAEFEAVLRREVEEARRKEWEAAEAAARERAEELARAQREAARIDEEVRRAERARCEAEESDEWQMGAYEEEEGEEGGGEGEVEEEGGGEWDARVYEVGDDEQGGERAERMPLEVKPSASGTRVRLESLAVAPAAMARAEALWAALACSRCSEQTELVLSGLFADAAQKKSWCAKCGALLSAALRPCTLCDGFDVAGYIDTINCVVVDVPRLSVLMQCGRCDAELRLPELLRGRTVQAGCRGCHAPLSLHMSNVQLSVLGVLGSKAARGGADDDDEMEQLLKKLRKKNLDQFKTLGLVIGKPLPNKGTCRHYSHSYRWLRFPCCGRAHPCAVCHAASDCPAADQGVWANRMLCGKCSRELPYSDTPCPHCGNTFAKPGGAHWQGGAGCRDQQTLSCKDSRKHKGTSASGAKKTSSAKALRVGVQGKRLTAAKAAAKAAP
ncbi:hypothetical protein AB1Y20_012574 [Prymnesium parvum]|uniref:CHY-type domain-containing protein n=1 Tax=Prymnesium parvum TaxID=97485 RepID=A0AB34IL31_PRYPA